MSRTDGGTRRPYSDGRRAKTIVIGAAMVAVVVLAVLALELRSTQATSRERVVSRFHDRAQVISALTQAVLATAAAPQEANRQYGAAQISREAIDHSAAQGHLAYALVLDRSGHVVGASSSLDAAGRARVAASPAVRAVLRGAPLALGDVGTDRSGAGSVVDLAVGFQTPSGRRVLVSGAPIAVFGAFIGSYLRRVPTRGGTAYVLDGAGRVIGARDAGNAAGQRVREPGLAALAQRKDQGAYGGSRYFVAEPVPTTSWHVVLTSDSSTLFTSVAGWRKWLPWLIFAALALSAFGLIALLRRITASATRLSAANAQLESSNALLRHAAELARSNAELEQFASIASHDLQEPLRKVQTFAAQLEATERDGLSEQGRDFLRRMSDAAGRMRTLIDDLLAFSRVSTKGRPFVPVALGEVADQALGDLEIAIAETGAQVTIGPLPTIDADPVQMRQLLLNLLGNALKFHRPGVTPEVTVNAHVADEIAELTIADNGMGFDPEFATRIFRAFERLHGTSAYPGTGIGLALCRKIVERHQGTITADARDGEGATFTIRLPLHPADTGDPSDSLFPDPHPETHALA